MQPLSMSTALRPAFCASMAHARPVGPAPITRRSKRVSVRGLGAGASMLLNIRARNCPEDSQVARLAWPVRSRAHRCALFLAQGWETTAIRQPDFHGLGCRTAA